MLTKVKKKKKKEILINEAPTAPVGSGLREQYRNHHCSDLGVTRGHRVEMSCVTYSHREPPEISIRSCLMATTPTSLQRRPLPPAVLLAPPLPPSSWPPPPECSPECSHHRSPSSLQATSPAGQAPCFYADHSGC